MSELALLERAEQMLATVASTDDALNLIDMAEAARVMARQAKLGTASINHATVVKLRAERRLADIVDEGQKAGAIAVQSPGRPQKSVRSADPFPSMPTPPIAPPPATLEEVGVDKQRLAEARKVRDNYTDEDIIQIAATATEEDRCIARTEFIKKTAHVSNNSGENEWYTPPEFIDAARDTFADDTCAEELDECYDGCGCSPITTDPATSAQAQENVGAKYAYTAEDNGLAQTWRGNVWMNPPYSQPLIGQFIDKLLAELDAGNVQKAIVLVNNATETEWGSKLLEHCQGVCFPKGRIRFLDPAGNPGGAPLQGQMIVYFDRSEVNDYLAADSKWTRVDAFYSAFHRFGPVVA